MAYEQRRFDGEAERPLDGRGHRRYDRFLSRAVEFGWRLELVVPREETETTRSTDENRRLERFWKREERRQEHRPAKPNELEKWPSPILFLCNPAP